MKRFLVGVFLVVAILCCNWALFNSSFFRVHDYTHAARISEMARALADGHFPVRWSQNFGYGYGMPLFNFYAPLPYYVGAVAFLAGLDIILSIKILFAIASISAILGAYKLGRLYFGYSGSLLVATLVGLAPYRALNLYIRGAVSEAWALAIIPWIIWSMLLVIRGKNKALMVFAISLSALALSHNISLMLATPVIALFGALEIWRVTKLKAKRLWPIILKLVGGGLLGLGLAAFYLLPAFAEKNATKVEEYILDAYFNYHLHFLYIRQFFQHHWQYGGSGWGPNDDISFGLGIGQLIALAGTSLMIGVSFLQKLQKRTLPTLLNSKTWWLATSAGVCLLITLGMTLEKSAPIWDRIAVLEYTQFPWRWLTVTVPFLGLVGAVATNFIPNSIIRWSYVLAVTLVVLSINTRYFFPEKYLTNPAEYYQTSPESISAGMSNILPDYIPKQMPKMMPSATEVITNKAKMEKFIVLSDKMQAKLISISNATDTEVVWSIADFPGWTVEVDGQPVTKQVSPEGLVSVTVPAGEHLVGAVLTLTETQKIAQSISAISVIVLLAAVAFRPHINSKITT